jgi:hypothetical protein
MNNYTAEQTNPAVLTVRFKDVAKGWEQWILCASDRHHDNIYCNWDLEKKHLEKARERGALICDFGDLFCAMQGKYDPRSNMDDLRPEDKVTNYFPTIVEHAVDFYKPYHENWLLLGHGNHETSILKRNHIDLTSDFVSRLNSSGANAFVGGYGGWVRFMFHINKTKQLAINMKYHHGAAKNPDAQVTRSVIQTNRQAVYQPDANIIANGHSHDAYTLPIARETLSQAGVPGHDILWFIRTPGYKDEYGDGSKGYHIEQGKPPKPIGCVWLHFMCNDPRNGRIDLEAIQEVI